MKMIIYAACGLIAGFLCGCIGTGGGIVIVFALTLCGYGGSRGNKTGDKTDGRDIYANTVASVLPMTVVSALIYYKNGSFELKEALVFIIPAIAGGLLGAFLLERLKTGVTNKIFAFLVIFAGATMLLR